MPRTKSKTRYSEWKLYNLNALYSVLESSHLILSKWKRLKVRVDGWVVAEPPVVDGDEWDDHRQSQSDNLRWNGGWWGKSQALQRQVIYVRLFCSTFLFFPTTLMLNFILCTKLPGTVPSFTVKCIYSLKLLKNRLPALHNSMVLESSLNNLPPTFHLLRNSVNTKSTLFANTRRSP